MEGRKSGPLRGAKEIESHPACYDGALAGAWVAQQFLLPSVLDWRRRVLTLRAPVFLVYRVKRDDPVVGCIVAELSRYRRFGYTVLEVAGHGYAECEASVERTIQVLDGPAANCGVGTRRARRAHTLVSARRTVSRRPAELRRVLGKFGAVRIQMHVHLTNPVPVGSGLSSYVTASNPTARLTMVRRLMKSRCSCAC